MSVRRRGLLLPVVLAMITYACSDGGGDPTVGASPTPGATDAPSPTPTGDTTPAPTADEGALIVDVSPSKATVVVTGPDGYSDTFTGDELLIELAPGVYSVAADADGYVAATDSITVAAGETAALSLNLRQEGEDDVNVGVLTAAVSPATARVDVQGPDDFLTTFQGSETLVDLEPGTYQATASADGYVPRTDKIEVYAGHASALSFSLEREEATRTSPVVYQDGEGSLVPIDPEHISPGDFVFYAWLEDGPGGIDPTAGVSPGAPTEDEQDEFAPILTQNLAAAWVGIRVGDAVYPVSGATVRWELDRQFADAQGSMQFGAADDGSNAAGFNASGRAEPRSIDDDQADTRTNNASLANTGFPIAVDFPLYNRTGVETPDTDGFTWVTLFSPDDRAKGRIIAVAMVADVEVGKEILIKDFVAQPEIEITKTVDPAQINLGADGVGTASFTVTVTNVGMGDATEVTLADGLTTDNADTYGLVDSTLPEDAVATNQGPDADHEGFAYSFPLDAGASVSFTFDAQVTQTDTYCNGVGVVGYQGEFETFTPDDLFDDACFTAIAPELAILKDFVDDEGVSLGTATTLQAGETATLRIRVPNLGSGAASDVSLVDRLDTVNGVDSDGDDPHYAVEAAPAGATLNDEDGFDASLGTVAADEVVTLTFPVTADADGVYCDLVSLFVGEELVDDARACLNVATPDLEITKANDVEIAVPGDSYTSIITLENHGNAAATGIWLDDRVGYNAEASVYVQYMGSNLDGAGGTYVGQTVTAPGPLILRPDDTIVFTVTSRVGSGSPSGDYCDIASYVSDNAGEGNAEACIFVPAYAALQTQLVDARDPVRVGGGTDYATTLYNEVRSNERVEEHALTYSFGVDMTVDNGQPGVFEQVSVSIYLDASPTRDANTGLVTSDPSSPSAVLLDPGSDYTLSTDAPGLQVIDFADALALAPDTAIYVVHRVEIPSDVTAGQEYSTNYAWDSVGHDSGTSYDAFSAETTTIIQ